MKTFITTFLILFSFNFVFCQLKWEHTCGPEGTASDNLFCGDEYAFVCDPIYLYRSTDGLSWEKFPFGGIQHLTIYKSTLVAVYNKDINQSPSETYLSISHDNGESWTYIGKPKINIDYHSITLLSHGLYVIDETRKKLLYTTDEGQKWYEKNIPVFTIHGIYAYQNQIYIYDGINLWRSDVNGENWQIIGFPRSVDIFQLIVKDSLMLAFVPDGMYYSIDSAKSWNFFYFDWILNFDSYPFFEVNGPYIYLLAQFNFFSRTTDFFEHVLTNLNPDQKLPSISDLKTFKGKLLVPTYGHGMHYWDENKFTLVAANKGLCTPTVYTMSNTPNYLWAATANNVFGYDLKTNQWTEDAKLPPPSRFNNKVNSNENGWMVSFSDTSYGHFYLSLDEGKNWNDIQVGTTNSQNQVQGINLLDDIIFVHFLDRSWRSDDQGKTWDTIPFKFVRQVIKYQNQYLLPNGHYLYSSNDKGLHWNVLTDLHDGFMESIESGRDFLIATIDPDGNANQFNYRLYHSNNGIDWIKSDSGLPAGDIKLGSGKGRPDSKLLFDYRDVHLLHMSTIGLYMCRDSTFNWVKMDDNENHGFFRYHMVDSILFGATIKQGVYKTSLNELITKVDNTKTKSNSTDFSIYPNPFDNKLYINFPGNESQTIQLYDQNGQKIKQLIQNSKDIELDLSDLNSGIYFIQIFNKQHPVIRKLIKYRS